MSDLLRNHTAFRYTRGARARVRTALGSGCEILAVPSARMMIVKWGTPAEGEAVLRQIAALEAGGDVEFRTGVLLDKPSGLRQVLTDEITVRFRRAPSPALIERLEQRCDLTVARRNEFVPRQLVFRLGDPSGTNTLKVATKVAELPEVEFASPNVISEFDR